MKIVALFGLVAPKTSVLQLFVYMKAATDSFQRAVKLFVLENAGRSTVAGRMKPSIIGANK